MRQQNLPPNTSRCNHGSRVDVSAQPIESVYGEWLWWRIAGCFAYRYQYIVGDRLHEKSFVTDPVGSDELRPGGIGVRGLMLRNS